MITKGNQKKAEQLGMPFGTANAKLKKSLLFQFIHQTGRGKCFQCGKLIQDITDLSIDHKEPWLDSDDPVSLFFDLDNIAFSHLSCNSAASRKNYAECGSYRKYYMGCRCDSCIAASQLKNSKTVSKRQLE